MENQYTIKITSQAQEQLREILHYIAFELEAPDAAVQMLDKLQKDIASLSYFPNRIALTEEEPWHSMGIHRMPVKNYLVYFWINEAEKKVQVTAILFNRRNQNEQLIKMNMK